VTTSHKLIDQQVNQYRILSHIDRGGMANVYLAEDVDLERKVAFKVMLDTLAADSQFAERFHREAKVVARLNHPNIVQIYTIGQTPAQQPYIAMQYIEGGSLQEKLKELADRRKLLTTEQALNIVRQIALALAAAHKAGIVHRDLKPANVLVRPDGTPVLVDLGIAAIKGGAKLTQTGGIIGTPAYMSPEQVRGVPLDGRSDLYALGIMLYEILAGMRPFEGDSSVAILHKQVYEEPLPLDKLRPNLPAELLAVVGTALQKDPAYRYQSAGEMVQAIDRAIRSEGLIGPNPQATLVLTQMNDSALLSRSRLMLDSKAEDKKPAAFWGILLALFFIGAVLIFFAIRFFSDGSPTPVPIVVPTAATVVENTAVPPSPQSTPDTHTEIPPTATVLPTETAVFTPTPIPSPIPVAGGLSGFGPNQIIYAANNTGYWGIYMLDLDSGQETAVLSDNTYDNSGPTWSPDGTQIAFHSPRNGNTDIYVLDVADGNIRRLTTHESSDLFPVWSPDNRQLAFYSTRNGNYDLYSIDVDTLALRQLTSTSFPETTPNWSPDGTQLLFETAHGDNSDIYLLNLSDLTMEPFLNTSANELSAVWSPDGSRIVFSSDEGGGDYELYMINADGTDMRQLTTNAVKDIYPTWSPDGSQLVYESWVNSLSLSHLQVDDLNSQTLTGTQYKQRFPNWLK